MSMIAPFGILALIAIVVVVAIVVGLVVILVSSKRRGETQPVAPPAQAAPPDGEERQAILKKLAAGELTKEQAEAQLERLGTPVPANVPPPPRKSGGKGCLIAVLAAVLLLPLLLILAVLGIGGCRWSHTRGVHQEAVRRQEQQMERVLREEMMQPVRPEEVK